MVVNYFLLLFIKSIIIAGKPQYKTKKLFKIFFLQLKNFLIGIYSE